MFKSKFYVVILILGIFALLGGSCTKPASTDVIEDIKWVLDSYGEPENLKTVLDGTEITATFDSARKRVSGSAGCNSYFGDYQIGDNKLTFLVIGHTEMYCLEPEGVMEQETQYLRLLSAAESYEIIDGKLQIVAGSQLLIFNAK